MSHLVQVTKHEEVIVGGMLRSSLVTAAFLLAIAVPQVQLLGQTSQPDALPAKQMPPKTWIDPETGHRVTRLSDERNSQSLYFNMNAFTPDGQDMIYVSPQGIHMLNLSTGKTTLVVAGRLMDTVVGTKTRRAFFKKWGDLHVYSVDLDTRAITTIAALPIAGTLESVNADETLLAGTSLEGLPWPAGPAKDFKAFLVDAETAHLDSTRQQLAHPVTPAPVYVDPHNAAMKARFDAHEPEDLYTVNIKTGEVKPIVKGKDWLAHVQFSPTDPSLILYAHEGPSYLADRVWTVRTDGSKNQLIHPRTEKGEAAEHEFWSPDGKTIWFDLQKPTQKNFFLAAYDVEAGTTQLYHMRSPESSVHFNIAADGSLFCGDGHNITPKETQPFRTYKPVAIGAPYIEVLRPVYGTQPNALPGDPSSFTVEQLVDLSKNNYEKTEPNARFTPDQKRIIFTSNMFGAHYVFAVDLDKGTSAALELGQSMK